MKNDKQIILAILFAILSLSAFTFALDRFLIAREEEQNEFSGFSVDGNSIAFSGDNAQNLPKLPAPPDVSTHPSPVDYTNSSISLGDGRSAVAKLDTATTTEDTNPLMFTSRLSIVDSKGVAKEIYKYRDLGSYLVIHKLSSDKNRLYFYARPDGLGGYYVLNQIFARKFFVYNFKTNKVNQIIVKNSTKLNMQQIEDISDDGNIVAFTREKTTVSKGDSDRVVVAVYYIKENKTFDLPNWEKEGYTIAGGAKFDGNNKITYQTAWNNPDNEHLKTVEYDLSSKTAKVLKSE